MLARDATVYVGLSQPACDDGFVPRSSRGPWTDDEHRRLLDSARVMAGMVGRPVGECVCELTRIVRAEAMHISWGE